MTTKKTISDSGLTTEEKEARYRTVLVMHNRWEDARLRKIAAQKAAEEFVAAAREKFPQDPSAVEVVWKLTEDEWGRVAVYAEWKLPETFNGAGIVLDTSLNETELRAALAAKGITI